MFIFPKQEKIDLYQPVARRVSILFGKLVAIKIALDQVKVAVKKRRFIEVTLFQNHYQQWEFLPLGGKTIHRNR